MTPEEIDLEAIGATGIQALLDQAMGAVDEESKRIFGSSEDTTYEKDSFYADRYTEKKYRLGSETGEKIEELVEKVRYLPQTDTLTQEEYDEYMKKLATLSDEQTGKQAQQVRYREVRSGEFNTWVGYAPVFRDDAKPNRDMDEYWKNVRFAGAGETGRIMGLFTQHKMIESSGRAEANMPAYSRRLWDDRGSFMPAPTIRTLVDVAMTVAVSCFTGGAGGIIMNALISTAFNMIDDAVFTLMDMANGMDPLDAVEGFAKKAATTFASSAISGAFNGVVPQGGGAPTGGLLQKMNLTDSVIGSTMLKGTEIMASNVASSAINSINLRGLVTGGDAFDEDAFGRGAFGRDAMAGVAAGMAGNAVTVGMGKINLSDANKTSLNDYTFDTAAIKSFNRFAGSIASTGVTYGLTGNAKVNLLNASMFGLTNKDGDPVSVGLFEFGFGKDGVQAGIGMGGTDMSLGTIAAAIRGMRESNKVIDWKYGSEKQQSDLNAINMLGWTGEYGNKFNVDLSKDIWNGKLNTRYEEMGANDHGYYDRAQRSDEIVLSTALLGGGKEAAAKLATVMSHEGTHAYGNRVEGIAHQQGLATYGQIASIFKLETDSGFTQSMVDAMNDPDSWKENVGSRDDWKFISYADGTHRTEAEYDKHGNLIKKVTIEYRDENGNVVGRVTPENQDFQDRVGQAESLVNGLTLDRAKALLGDDLYRISTYDDQTLSEVLHLDDSQIQSLRRASGASIQDMGLSDSKLAQLVGEALLKRSGYAYDGSNWRKENPTNLYLDGVSLTDNLTKGYINAKALSGGTFDYSTAMVSVGRDPLSNMIFNDENGYNKALAGRDSVTVSSYNLDGSQRNAPKTFDGWTTVQTAYPGIDSKGNGYDYSSFMSMTMHGPGGASFDINIGPETVQEGSIAWTITPLDHDWDAIGKVKGDILLRYSSGKILHGESINTEGFAGYYDIGGRLFVHPTTNFINMGCAVTGTIGALVGQTSYTNFLNYLTNNLDLNIGYTLLGDLYQKNNPYFSVSR